MIYNRKRVIQIVYLLIVCISLLFLTVWFNDFNTVAEKEDDTTMLTKEEYSFIQVMKTTGYKEETLEEIITEETTLIIQDVSECESEEILEHETTFEEISDDIVQEETTGWQGKVLNAYIGTVEGPSGKETYYNLNMSRIVRKMKSLGYDYEYYVREDGVKMFGEYIMCAANLELRPIGTILETSLGTAIVCDTGTFAMYNKTQIDIAVDW